MKLSTLEAFCTAVEAGSISAAARRMHLSQPSLSERIAELEREAGAPLLERSPSGVLPTPEGALFHERAVGVLAELKALERYLRGVRPHQPRCVRFGACFTLGEHFVPGWLHAYRAQAAGVAVELEIGNNPEIVARVCEGRIALGIVADDGELGDVAATRLFTDELVAIVPPGHPWSRRPISWRELHREPFISRERQSATKQAVDRTVTAAGARALNADMELPSTTAIKEAVASGLGFSVVSRAAVSRELCDGTLACAQGISLRRDWVLIERRDATLTDTERSLREHLLAAADRLDRDAPVTPSARADRARGGARG